MNTLLTRRALFTMPLAGAWPASAPWAQSGRWPERALRIVLPQPPGGGPDASIRAIAEALRKPLGQSVIVENKAGAAGLIGLKAVSAAPADGYTLAYMQQGYVTLDILTPGLDISQEFTPLSMVSASPWLFVVPATSPYRHLAELIAAARAAPGKLSYGTAGVGSPMQMCLAGLFEETGADLLHVPYKSGMLATTGIASGETQISAAVPGSATALAASGRLRIIAVATSHRMPQFPDVPTVQEALGKPYVFATFSGLMVKKGTPPEIVKALFDAIVAATRDPLFIDAVAKGGGVVEVSASPQEFGERLQRQHAIEQVLVTKLGIKPE